MPNIAADQHGKRLDLVLTFLYPQYSRSNIRKLLDAGKVKINGQVEYRPNYKVQTAEEIVIDDVESLQRKQLAPADIKLDIVYQDSDIVIVNKPAGLKVHPTHQNENTTLLNALYGQLGSQLTEFGVNLVNRIDKDTSGLIMAAISPQGAWHYAQQFATNQVQKTYLAAVYGNWFAKFGEEKITDNVFLQYNHLERVQVIDIHQTKGEHAQTSFQYLDSNPKQRFTLLQAQPTTGRTHQIRVQLAHLGFPIVGDTKYAGKEYKRLLLHAFKLRFTKLDGKEIRIETPVPKEFSSLFKWQPDQV
jgi:23S rRNA pseudouridine1911/1915/1917 synthase